MADGRRLPEKSVGGVVHPADQRKGITRSPTIPVHDADQLGFDEDLPTPQEAWSRLGDKVKQRVSARTGDVIDWWATQYEPDREIRAVVLGTRALVTVDPTVTATKSRAHRVSSLSLDEASFRQIRITENTRDRTVAPADDHSQPSADRDLASRLGTRMSALLGHLPVRVQKMLQEPFIDDHQDLWCDCHYLRYGSGQELGGARLEVWLYLANRRYVTFASGTGHGYHESSGAVSWDLICRRGTVAKHGAPGVG